MVISKHKLWQLIKIYWHFRVLKGTCSWKELYIFIILWTTLKGEIVQKPKENPFFTSKLFSLFCCCYWASDVYFDVFIFQVVGLLYVSDINFRDQSCRKFNLTPITLSVIVQSSSRFFLPSVVTSLKYLKMTIVAKLCILKSSDPSLETSISISGSPLFASFLQIPCKWTVSFQQWELPILYCFISFSEHAM